MDQGLLGENGNRNANRSSRGVGGVPLYSERIFFFFVGGRSIKKNGKALREKGPEGGFGRTGVGPIWPLTIVCGGPRKIINNKGKAKLAQWASHRGQLAPWKGKERAWPSKRCKRKQTLAGGGERRERPLEKTNRKKPEFLTKIFS